MSLFTALNFTPDEALQEAEQHSRELQIEESFRVFQSALFHLKAKRFNEAAEKFRQLFSIDVIKPDKWGMYRFSSPTLDSLRYLAYRNRGVFYYQYLREHYQKLSPEDVVDHILKVIENLLEAIQHCDCDVAVVELLITIAKSFRSEKLERYLLEYEILKEPEFITTVARRRHILPQMQKSIYDLAQLLQKLKDYESINTGFIRELKHFIQDKRFPEVNLVPVLSQIKDMKISDEHAMTELNVVEIVIDEVSWEGIAESLMAALPKFKSSNFFGRISDPYSEVDEPFENVKLVVNDVEKPLDNEEVKEIEKDTAAKESAVSDPVNSSTISIPGLDSSKRNSDTQESSRSVQRSSKRFKEKTQITDEPEVMSVHQFFFEDLNHISAEVDSSIKFEVEKFSPEDTPRDSPIFTALTDLYDCLSSWTNRHSEFLNQNESKQSSKSSGADTESIFQLNSLFRTSVLTNDSGPTQSLTDLPTQSVKNFISEMNARCSHFQEIRLNLLDNLLSTDANDFCLIVDTFWSPVLFKTIESFVLGIETNLYKMLDSKSVDSISFGLSVYEILVNMMGDIYTGISHKKLQGQKSNELETQRNKLERKVTKWCLFLESATLSLRSRFRFWWTKFCYLQYTTDITDNKLVDALIDIESGLKEGTDCIDISYANYSNIPRFNMKMVQNQLSRINMIRKVTTIDMNEGQKEDTTSEQQIEILREALTGEATEISHLNDEEKSMVDFILNSPFLLKIKLWKILMSYYSENDPTKLQMVYFKILKVLYDKICSEDYAAQSQLQRQQTLLATINSIGSFTDEFLKVFGDKSNWKYIDHSMLSLNIDLLLHVIYLLYPITFYESMCQRDHFLKSFFRKAVKSSAKLKKIFIDLLSVNLLFYYIFSSARIDDNKDNSVLNLIWTTHSLTGKFGFCDSSHGILLNLAELLLCKAPNDTSFIQLKQVLWCRYHLLVSGDSSVSVEHTTKAISMSKESAITIGTYLIEYHYEGKNPLLATGNKTNLKQILDHVVQVIGDLNFNGNHILCRNRFFFEKFLDSSISTRTLRNSYSGNLSLEFTKPNDHLQGAVDSGVFFVAGVQNLNLYRIRKKATQARPSELDSIISMLKTDILYNTGRFESWFLLGRCYSYVVEDDLIWTSDKLAYPEKRKGTTSTQRKAILCYLMALSLSQQTPPQQSVSQEMDREIILKDLFETLSEEMLNGYLKPMDKSCFQWEPPATVRLCENGEIISAPVYDKQSISDFNVQQGIFLGFVKADELSVNQERQRSIQRNWKNLYYISKLQFKLNVLSYAESDHEVALQACELAGIVSKIKNPILEPHYFLVSSIYKCVKLEALSVPRALDVLSKNNTFFQKDSSFWEVTHSEENNTSEFNLKIIDLLRIILSHDKMKWHHRPKYRIARILYEDMKDLEGAMAEMDDLMFLKSSNKNLVNIWKPDLERPGKHFAYTYQYVMFYLDMLFCSEDYVSIALVAKKLRRFGPGMINVSQATERAMRLFCLCVQSQFQVNEKEYADKLLPSLNYQLFLKNSADLFQAFNKAEYDPKVLEVLAHAYQLKKGNNGYDGICLAIYFKFLYLPFVEKKEAAKTATPASNINTEKDAGTGSGHVNTSMKVKGNNTRKRVSKKDAFDKIAGIVEKKIT